MARKIEELRGLTNEELKVRRNDAEEELANLRFQHGSHQLESPIKVRNARRRLARLNTLVKERELGITAKDKE